MEIHCLLSLNRTVQHAIHAVTNNKELMGSEAKDRIYSFRDDTARLYDALGMAEYQAIEVFLKLC